MTAWSSSLLSLIAFLAASSQAFAPPVRVHAAEGAPLAAAAHRRRAGAVRCGPRVRIVSVGKAARDDAWVASAIDMYTKRLRSTLDIESVFVRDDNALLASKENSERQEREKLMQLVQQSQILGPEAHGI